MYFDTTISYLLVFNVPKLHWYVYLELVIAVSRNLLFLLNIVENYALWPDTVQQVCRILFEYKDPHT